MHWIVGIVIAIYVINAMGWLFWAIAGVVALVFAATCYVEWKEEQELPPELREERQRERERARERRRDMREKEEHERRLLELRQQQVEEERKANSKNAVLGAAGKIATGLVISYLTGHHHNHHKH
jgi:hypothetical protein